MFFLHVWLGIWVRVGQQMASSHAPMGRHFRIFDFLFFLIFNSWELFCIIGLEAKPRQGDGGSQPTTSSMNKVQAMWEGMQETNKEGTRPTTSSRGGGWPFQSIPRAHARTPPFFFRKKGGARTPRFFFLEKKGGARAPLVFFSGNLSSGRFWG